MNTKLVGICLKGAKKGDKKINLADLSNFGGKSISLDLANLPAIQLSPKTFRNALLLPLYYFLISNLTNAPKLYYCPLNNKI